MKMPFVNPVILGGVGSGDGTDIVLPGSNQGGLNPTDVMTFWDWMYSQDEFEITQELIQAYYQYLVDNDHASEFWQLYDGEQDGFDFSFLP